jgi:hypothetical protein
MDESLAGEWGADHGVARVRTGSAEVRGSCLILHARREAPAIPAAALQIRAASPSEGSPSDLASNGIDFAPPARQSAPPSPDPTMTCTSTPLLILPNDLHRGAGRVRPQVCPGERR